MPFWDGANVRRGNPYLPYSVKRHAQVGAIAVFWLVYSSLGRYTVEYQSQCATYQPPMRCSGQIETSEDFFGQDGGTEDEDGKTALLKSYDRYSRPKPGFAFPGRSCVLTGIWVCGDRPQVQG